MKYTLEIQKTLFQVEDNKSLLPKDKIRMLRQAVAIADENEDVEWAYDIRLKLIRECYFVASTDELIREFSWILNAYETHPDLFEENDFLWQYKWVLGEMYSNSKVSMQQILSIMEDFKTRLERNGYGLRPYYDRLYDEALIIRDFEKARKYLDLRNSAPDDAMGSCPACTLDYELDYYLLTDDFEEAYNRAQPLLSKQLTCAHVPARTFCILSYYATKAGKPQLAAELLEKGEDEIAKILATGDESLIVPVSVMICCLFGKDPAKAWEYIERSFPWFMESSDYSRYCYAFYLLEGMKHLPDDTVIQLHLPVETPFYSSAGQYEVIHLKQYFMEIASELADAFDQRNNNSAFQKELNELAG